MNVSKHKTHPACGKLSWVGLVSTYVKRSGNAIVGNCCRRINKSPLCILFHRTQCSVEFCARVPLLSALDLQRWCLASALTSILESFPNPNKCRDRTQLTSGLPTMCMDNNNMTTRWKFYSWKRQNQVTVVFDTHSFIHISTFLRVLLTACSTFWGPAAQVSLSESQLYPPSSIRRYCYHGMPGMSSPSTHNRQSTMKVHVGACGDGFPQQSKFQQQVRHWCTETWWDNLLPDVYLHKAPQCKQVVPGS